MSPRDQIERTPSAVADGYEALSGLEKRDRLFAAVLATAYRDEDLPSLALGLFAFLRSAFVSYTRGLLSETLTRVGDELDPPKRKLFHTFGTTAKVRYTPRPGVPYSGILGEGGRGLARFSYAGPTLAVGKVPGLGLKFPATGGPSADAVVMPGLDRQRSRSVFEHAYTNILPSPKLLNVTMRIIRFRFERVAEHGRGLHQPVERLAAVRQDDPAVDDPVAPERVTLRPTTEVTGLSDPRLDFRIDLARNIPQGTKLFDVLAVHSPRGSIEPIGALTTESPFVASAYGDFRLFIRHSDRFLRERFR